MNDRKKNTVEQEGSCPVCHTVMLIRTTPEEITLHKCPGCLNHLAITEEYLIVVPSGFASKLLRENMAVPCGNIVKKDMSQRFSRNKPVDSEYTGIISEFLETEDVGPDDLLAFLDAIDDSPLG